MTGDIVYQSVLNAIRKDKRGLSLSLDEYNFYSRIVDKKVIIAFMSRWEDDIEITSHAGFLKVPDYPITLVQGIGVLPSNYFRIMGDPTYVDADGNTTHIDVITSKERTYRERDYLTKATLKNPTCVIGGQDSLQKMQIRVYPASITSILIDYVRDTVSPFLDYYINDTTLQTTYLTKGQTLTLPFGCTYRDGTQSGTITSTTQDWEWDLHELPWIVSYFLQELGVTLPDELLIQVGKVESAELQNKKVW